MGVTRPSPDLLQAITKHALEANMTQQQKNSTAKSWRLGTWRMTFLLYTGFCSQNFQRLCICEILTYYGHLQGIYGWEMFGVCLHPCRLVHARWECAQSGTTISWRVAF